LLPKKLLRSRREHGGRDGERHRLGRVGGGRGDGALHQEESDLVRVADEQSVARAVADVALAGAELVDGLIVRVAVDAVFRQGDRPAGCGSTRTTMTSFPSTCVWLWMRSSGGR